jgi:tRNA (adenine57-N1/adenine58-N1)-methyltransferase catalytic subunit
MYAKISNEISSFTKSLADGRFCRGGVQVIAVECRDIVGLGFPEVLEQKGTANAVFLDLPAPWNVVPSAKKCLRPNGVFCSFSPCIEQVQRTCAELAKLGFCEIRTVEILERPYAVDVLNFAAPSEVKRAKGPMKKRRKLADVAEDGSRTLVATRPVPHVRGHTGYLTFARKFVLPPAGSSSSSTLADAAETEQTPAAESN